MGAVDGCNDGDVEAGFCVRYEVEVLVDEVVFGDGVEGVVEIGELEVVGAVGGFTASCVVDLFFEDGFEDHGADARVFTGFELVEASGERTGGDDNRVFEL